jgi:hypothetical protein
MRVEHQTWKGEYSINVSAVPRLAPLLKESYLKFKAKKRGEFLLEI